MKHTAAVITVSDKGSRGERRDTSGPALCAVLAEYGFVSEDGGWVLQKDGYLLKVTFREEETASGTLRTYDIAGIEGDKTLLTLPSTRYIPKEVSP